MEIRNRPDAHETWDEKTVLLTMLRAQQEVAVSKVRGLAEKQARATPLATSPHMSLANVLNHLRWVEWSWVHVDILDEPDQGPWTRENPDADFDEGSALPLGEVIKRYERQAERTRAFFAQADLDDGLLKRPDSSMNRRWVLVHLVEETARHNGHLDLMREMADGQVGYLDIGQL
jgi:uncharacterized damage-inducible protein DinB